MQELTDCVAPLPLATLLLGEAVSVTGAPPRLTILFSLALLLPGLSGAGGGPPRRPRQQTRGEPPGDCYTNSFKNTISR